MKGHFGTRKRKKGKESDNSCARGGGTDGAQEGAIGVLSASGEGHVNVRKRAMETTLCAGKAKKRDGKRRFFGRNALAGTGQSAACEAPPEGALALDRAGAPGAQGHPKRDTKRRPLSDSASPRAARRGRARQDAASGPRTAECAETCENRRKSAENWWARRESNPHSREREGDFKSPASAVPPLARDGIITSCRLAVKPRRPA